MYRFFFLFNLPVSPATTTAAAELTKFFGVICNEVHDSRVGVKHCSLLLQQMSLLLLYTEFIIHSQLYESVALVETVCLLNGTRCGSHLVWVVSHFCIKKKNFLINRVNYLKLTERKKKPTTTPIPSLIKNEIYPLVKLKLLAGNLFVCYDWPNIRNCLEQNVLRFFSSKDQSKISNKKTPVRHFHQKHITFLLIVIQQMKNKNFIFKN